MWRDKKTYLFLLKLKEYIDELNSGNWIIVVEGFRDRDALIHLGVKCKIVCFSTQGRSIYERVESILDIAKDREIIILTDFDEAGMELNKEISAIIAERGGRLLALYRDRLKRILYEKSILHIQDLNRYSDYINILSLKSF